MGIGLRRGMSPVFKQKIAYRIFDKFDDEIPENLIIELETDFSDFVVDGYPKPERVDELADYIYQYYLGHVKETE